jgi:hypothetical protein
LSACIVYKAVDAAMTRDYPRHKRFYGFLISNVGYGALGFTAIRRDLAGHFIELGFFAPNKNDGRAEARQFMGRTAANAAAPAGDDMHLASEQARPEDAAVARGLSHGFPPGIVFQRLTDR